MTSEIVSALIGAVIGGVVSPIALDEYRAWRHERHWARPRKRRLKKLLQDRETAPEGFRSLERLCLETGMKPEDCRTLLIEIGARGGSMTQENKPVEAWTLDPLQD